MTGRRERDRDHRRELERSRERWDLWSSYWGFVERDTVEVRRETVGNVYDALRPGTRFALYEIRLVPSGVSRVLDPLVRALYRRFGNWNAEGDVLEELRAAFDRTGVVRTFALGTNYVTVAGKGSPRAGSY